MKQSAPGGAGIACGLTWATSSYTSGSEPCIRPSLSLHNVSEPATTSVCAHCNTPLLPDERFCSSCGKPVRDLPDESPWASVLAQLTAATLGEFEVTSELGRGGMAAVYLAHEIALNRLVAIKVMAPGLFLGPGMVDRFRQEAVTVANLSHPNIITIHAVRQVEDLHFLVMKFVEGRSVEAVLASHGPLPIDTVRTMLFHVGSGLAYAHRRGVIHRDVKPANILLDADGNAIVTDFGIAKLTENDGHTQTGTMVGTPSYMSPEQCVGATLTWSSDLYSLGIVAYELLTGSVPFTGNAFAVMQAHTATPPPPIRDRRADCPPEVEAAVTRMLAKTPAERFASMAEALAALGAASPGPNDPVRQVLERLAIPDPNSRRTEAIRAPASPIPRGAPRVGQLSLSGAPDLVAAGDRFTLHAIVRSDTGATLAGRVVAWSSNDDTIAAVTANGVVTARAPGRVNITATCEGLLASLPLTVLPAGAGRRPARTRLWIAAAVVVALAAAGVVLLARRLAERPPAANIAALPPATDQPTAPPPAPLPPPPSATSPAGASTTAEKTAAPHRRTTNDSTGRHSTAKATPAATDSAHTVTPPPLASTPVSVPVNPPPAVVAAPPPPPPPPPSAPPVSPEQIVQQVQSAVQNYVSAIRARSVDQMRRIYPGLTSERATEWQSQFDLVGHDGVEQLGVTLAGPIAVTPSATGESAVAQFTLKLALEQHKGSSQTSQIAFRAAMRHDGDVWHIDALEQHAVR